jgi:putative ABC transport system permease protein
MSPRSFFRHLRRESRGSRARLAFFAGCLAIGVAAVVAVAGFSAALDRGIHREARQLLAADLAVRGRQPIPAEVEAAVDAIPGAERTAVLETVTLVARPGDENADGGARSQLVELKILDGVYPFYGEVELLGAAAPGPSPRPSPATGEGATARPGSRPPNPSPRPSPATGEGATTQPGSRPPNPSPRPSPATGEGATTRPSLADLLGEDTTVVGPEVLRRLRLETGDLLRIGHADFRIAAVVEKEPDRVASAFNLGPRVFLDAAAWQRTGLDQTGSRLLYRVLVRLPAEAGEDVERIADEIEALLPGDERFRVETWRQAQPSMRRGLERMERYLGLAALLSLLIGGIGVAQTVRAWLAGRMDAIAVLKCLGYRPREVLWLYLAQTAALGLIGSTAGALLGVAVEMLAAQVLRGVLPVESLELWQPLALVRGVVLGVGVALIFSLPPLMAARRTPPIRVLRRDAEPIAAGRWTRFGTAAALIAGVFGLAAWQSRSLVDGALFTAGLLAVTALLSGAAWLLTRLAKRPRIVARPWLRYGLAALHRPGASTTGAIVALGLGILVVLTMFLVERRLDEQLRQELPPDAPTAFLIDIQPDQWPGVEALLERQEASRIDSLPMITARLAAIDGNSAEDLLQGLSEDEGDARWALRREQRMTYAEDLPEGNVVVDGELWSDPEAMEVSVEQEFADLIGVGVGSVMRFDVQGVPLDLKVGTVRTVDWDTFGLNFYLIVEPGVLEEAPQRRIAATRLPQGREQDVQDALVAEFPNVTLIRTREVLEKVAAMLSKLGMGVRILGLLTVFAGLAILAGAIGAEAVRRGAEVALLKTLGMTRRQIVATFATEYALVGLVAGVLGAAGGGVLAYFVLTRGMDVPWRASPVDFLQALLVTVALAVVAGLLASVPALQKRPVEVLRSAGE